MMLKNNGLVVPMGRVGAAGDNALMGSFHSMVQNSVLGIIMRETREEFRLAIATWIERTYHRRHHKSSLSRMTPVKLEAVFRAVDGVDDEARDYGKKLLIEPTAAPSANSNNIKLVLHSAMDKILLWGLLMASRLPAQFAISGPEW